MSGPTPTIVVAGATGDLGSRIVDALLERGVQVRALVRPSPDATGTAGVAELERRGVEVGEADPRDVASMARACAGATCVVSALNGLEDVVLERQGLLLDAAVAAGVPRFVPSDFSADHTRSAPGRNRNLDLRRRFAARADAAPLQVTSILNGAFMELLDGDMPIVVRRLRRVLHWGDADQPLDFTTKDDVAAYTADAALDPTTPRYLRIAGDTVSVRDLAQRLTDLSGDTWRPLPAGGLVTLSLMIAAARRFAPGRGEVFPAWQGMQYTRDMFSGDVTLDVLDGARYGTTWTTVADRLATAPAFADLRG